MNHWYYIASIAAVSYIVALSAGFVLGYFYNNLVERLTNLTARLKGLEDEAADTSPAVIDTSPRLIEQKRRQGKLPSNDDEESAIVTVKSPVQLKREREEKIQHELDEITGRSSHGQ